MNNIKDTDTNFWNKLSKPIFALAPMEDVTDTVFREIVADIASDNTLSVLMTEFANTDGLCHKVGRDVVSKRFYVNQSEKELLKKKNIKLVAQIWGNKPEYFTEATKWINENFDFDGIDINFGCPVKNVVKSGCCSALIDNPSLAQEIVYATKEATNLPVSVKTRTGVKTHQTERWIKQLLETKPTAITLHGRTQKMQSEFPAEWSEIKKAVEVRNSILPDMPILGNGDVFTYDDALQRIKETGVDGVMIGRGIFKNPWFFNPNINPDELSFHQKLSLLWKHATLYNQTWKDDKNFAIIRRFFKIYSSEFSGAGKLRAKLMTTKSLEDVVALLKDFYKFKEEEYPF
ncbi:MAG: tRNA dihydrouridine synthase [Bacteroidales bacterium]